MRDVSWEHRNSSHSLWFHYLIFEGAKQVSIERMYLPFEFLYLRSSEKLTIRSLMYIQEKKKCSLSVIRTLNYYCSRIFLPIDSLREGR